MSSFIELCLQGVGKPENIDDYVDAWHANDQGLQLYQFLGMTRAEYGLWVADPGVLPLVLDAHRTGENVEQLIERVHSSRSLRASRPHA